MKSIHIRAIMLLLLLAACVSHQVNEKQLLTEVFTAK